MQTNTKYFLKSGPVNTAETVTLALARAAELQLKHLVVASNSGASVQLCLARGFDVVWVTHHVGFVAAGEDEAEPEVRASLTAQGVKILTTTHLMAGIDRALRLKAGGIYPAEIVAHTLRMFGQGVKVAVECSVMALDAGLIPYGTPIMALGGSGRGLDSALVLRPHHSSQFFETKIMEICCKPHFALT
ncbi:MAG: hypothetical protein M0Z55_08330 [Peptococcaceae bacterium]|nr:hypothetical protein [Peptococcaceae bacterium]